MPETGYRSGTGIPLESPRPVTTGSRPRFLGRRWGPDGKWRYFDPEAEAAGLEGVRVKLAHFAEAGDWPSGWQLSREDIAAAFEDRPVELEAIQRLCSDRLAERLATRRGG
ncbi:MAG: hypothetical protein L0227_09820 [Chloroflexi bacterium]|nr:hypothetical protein [Chloroflexota bacterium]